MKDVINQIIQIDDVAYENKNKNEEILSKKKQEYENLIAGYRDEKIVTAKKNAQAAAEETEIFIKNIEDLQNKEIEKVSGEIEKKYLNSEQELIKKIFNKLIVLEG